MDCLNRKPPLDFQTVCLYPMASVKKENRVNNTFMEGIYENIDASIKKVSTKTRVGLLLADRLNDDQRKAIGWTLFIAGAISTIPLVIEVLSKRQ